MKESAGSWSGGYLTETTGCSFHGMLLHPNDASPLPPGQRRGSEDPPSPSGGRLRGRAAGCGAAEGAPGPRLEHGGRAGGGGGFRAAPHRAAVWATCTWKFIAAQRSIFPGIKRLGPAQPLISCKFCFKNKTQLPPPRPSVWGAGAQPLRPSPTEGSPPPRLPPSPSQ